jgi:membrane-associated protease RseP (regulator of RpoE activity)
MLYALGVVFFVVGVLASIGLHEIGHLVPAKRFGVKVTQYMIGFGPTLWSRRRGDTEYGVKAVPLGGYIRMIGMVPPRRDGRPSRWPRRMATAVEDFRQMSRSEVGPGDDDRQFYRLGPGKKMIIMLGGPCMNLAIYLVLTVILLTVIGSPQNNYQNKVGAVLQCVVPATSSDANATTCPADATAAPAFQKLKPGDTIESVNGVRTSSWNSLTDIIRDSANKPLTLDVLRDGRQVSVVVTPVKNTVYVNSSGTKTAVSGFLGIEPTSDLFVDTVSIGAVPGQIVSQVGQGLSAVTRLPSSVANLWGVVVDGKQRDAQGAIGLVGIGRLNGDIADSHQLDVRAKISALIGLLASVNLLLFMLNLLPLLPLDGGHVAGAIVESVRRGWARLRDRRRASARVLVGPGGEALPAAAPRPKVYVDTAQMLPVIYAVATVLFAFTLLVLYADIVKPIKLS